MKSHFWAAAALCCISVSVLITSCDVDIIQTRGKAVVNINTATLYDKLDITDLMTEKMAEDDFIVVTDTVLVYDQQGQLVAKAGTESSSLQNVSIDLSDLPLGSYTLVAWQTTTRGIDPIWPLVDEEKLSTVHLIKEPYMITSSFDLAVGLYSTTLTIGSTTETIQAEMEPMGSIVDFQVDGLTSESKYSRIELYGQSDAPFINGFYLDPACPEADKWIPLGDITEKDRKMGTVYPDFPPKSNFTLIHGENKLLAAYGVDKTTKAKTLLYDAALTLLPGTNTTFYFDLDKYAYQPPYFGLTEDFSEWKAARDDEFLISDPFIQWGADYQTVRNHVESKLWWRPYNDDLEEDEHGWFRIYRIARRLLEVYYFKTEDGKDLFRTFVYTDTTVPAELAYYHIMKQGFTLKGILRYPEEPGRDYLYYLSPDSKTQVLLLEYETGNWQIFYMPTNPDELSRIIPAPLT